MLLPEHAAVLSNTTPREIYRRVENGEVHFVETREGDLFICCRTITSIKPAEAMRCDRERLGAQEMITNKEIN
jgi:hypothetical protein